MEKTGKFIVYRNSRKGVGGYFLMGDTDEAWDIGGTLNVNEARRFSSKAHARRVISGVAVSTRGDAGDFVICAVA